MLALPPLILLAIAAALGAGIWMAALNVKYRDFRYVVPFIVQLGLYISPVGFPSSVVPEQWRLLYSLNPMVGRDRRVPVGDPGPAAEIYWPGFLLSIILTVVILVSRRDLLPTHRADLRRCHLASGHPGRRARQALHDPASERRAATPPCATCCQ